jgi:hypothetical protein
MTREEFDRKVIGKETEFIVEFDIRPFGAKQNDAIGVFLAEQRFRHSVGALNKSKRVVMIVEADYEITAQVEDHVEQLKSAGLKVSIERR